MNITDKLKAKILRDYASTHSIEKAAKRSGVGKFLAHRVLVDAGVERDGLKRHYRRVRKLPDYQLLKQEYEAGASLNALAAKYGTVVRSVSEALWRIGTKMRRGGGTVKPLTQAQREEIPSLYAMMKSQCAVATHLGTSQSKVSKHLRYLGIVSAERPSGVKHGSWKGGRWRDRAGYIHLLTDRDDPMFMMAHKSTGYTLEHRLVMARSLGRPLERQETVHHINGDKSDNRVENLQLRQGKHGNGVVHRCCVCGSTNVETVKLN